MSVKAALLGAWKMVSWTRESIATGETSDAMGPNPIGYIAYHPDGRMMALVVKRDRPAPAGRAPTDEEKVKLFDTMLAYSATYRVEDDRVVHHVDASWNQAWTGMDLIRPYTLDGDTLTISEAPSKDPATGDDLIYRIVFNKVRSPN